jgi:hypothetical protein
VFVLCPVSPQPATGTADKLGTKPPFEGGGTQGGAQFILYSFFFILYSLIVEITETVGLKNRE